jgi:hypothetical protein
MTVVDRQRTSDRMPLVHPRSQVAASVALRLPRTRRLDGLQLGEHRRGLRVVHTGNAVEHFGEVVAVLGRHHVHAQPQRVTLIPKRVAVRSRRLHHDDRLALGLLQRPQQTQERDGLAWVLELHELEHFPPNRRDRGNELRLRHVDRHNAAHRQQRQKRLHVELFDIYRGITTLAFHPG